MEGCSSGKGDVIRPPGAAGAFLLIDAWRTWSCQGKSGSVTAWGWGKGTVENRRKSQEFDVKEG